jgi:hypothetical protein
MTCVHIEYDVDGLSQGIERDIAEYCATATIMEKERE